MRNITQVSSEYLRRCITNGCLEFQKPVFRLNNERYFVRAVENPHSGNSNSGNSKNLFSMLTNTQFEALQNLSQIYTQKETKSEDN